MTSQYFHQRATREQIEYVNGLVSQGMNRHLGSSPSQGDRSLFNGLLGETVTKDLFGFMRSSYRTADKGVDMVVEGMKVDIKTSNFNPGVDFFDGVFYMKKAWLDRHEKDKLTDVLLFVGCDQRQNTMHYLGWLTVAELKVGLETGDVRAVNKGDIISETNTRAVCDTLVIPRPSMHRFADPQDFKVQMLELATAPATKWEFQDVEIAPVKKEAVQALTKPHKESEPPQLDPTTFKTFEGRIDDLTTVFTVVCTSALQASKIRVWLNPERVQVKKVEERSASGKLQALFTCFYCGSGFTQQAAGRQPWRRVCRMDECREKYKKDWNEYKQEQKENRPE